MTPNELKQILTSIETVKTALVKARENANVVECLLKSLPDTSKISKIFEETQTSLQYCENNISEVTFPLDIQELNAILNITTKVRDI